MSEQDNGQENDKRRAVIDPDWYSLEFAFSSPLHDPEPTEYLTQVHARIRLAEDQAEDPAASANQQIPSLALRMSLTLYDLERAHADGQIPLEIFDCVSEGALEIYNQLYDGFALRPEVEVVVADDGVTSPSLLVIEAVEVLPRHRGRGLGLVAVLKAMQVLGPTGGVAVLVAAPLEHSLSYDIDPATWRHEMEMDAFPPDGPEVRDKLAAYWGRLGFKGVANSSLQICSLGKILPTVPSVLEELSGS